MSKVFRSAAVVRELFVECEQDTENPGFWIARIKCNEFVGEWYHGRKEDRSIGFALRAYADELIAKKGPFDE